MTLAIETIHSRNIRAIARREFDGVICFGGCDWWYHNRAHYDIQFMRHFARSMPVLYVNSIGIRVPRLGEGAMFAKRIVRKLRSWMRGFVKVDANFAVFSPVVIPGKTGMRISKRTLAPQVRLAAQRMGIRRPLVWVNTPSAIEAVDGLNAVGIVYERTDRWEAFPEANVKEICGYDQRGKSMADVSLFASRHLFDLEAADCHNAMYLDHGVEFERFAQAAKHKNIPADLANISRPRVALVGAIDAHKIDVELLKKVAASMPRVNFVLIGGCTLPSDWCTLPNVHQLGQRPYEAVPDYMAACDVMIMPWGQNDWIRACNPIKLKEYLAVGRPVISTPFDELQHYEGFVKIARGHEAFAAAIADAIANPCNPASQQQRVQRETWQFKHEQLMSELSDLGLFAITN